VGGGAEARRWRTIITVDPSLPCGIEVRSRTGRFPTTQVPERHALALGFRKVLDGELVAVSDVGDINFYRLGDNINPRTLITSSQDIRGGTYANVSPDPDPD
jgi:ATP-dependent DNA ligase